MRSCCPFEDTMAGCAPEGYGGQIFGGFCVDEDYSLILACFLVSKWRWRRHTIQVNRFGKNYQNSTSSSLYIIAFNFDTATPSSLPTSPPIPATQHRPDTNTTMASSSSPRATIADPTFLNFFPKDASLHGVEFAARCPPDVSPRCLTHSTKDTAWSGARPPSRYDP
jgi:hypothetical protein